MNTKKLLLNSLLALGLAGVGAAYAADETAVPVLDRETIRAQHRDETAGMTAEQREQYQIQKQAEMTDEQRAALRVENHNKKAEQKKNKSGSGNGTMLREGSGAGSQGGGQGAGAGGGMRGR